MWDRADAVDEGLVSDLTSWGAALLGACDKGDRSLSIVLTDDACMSELNAQWRGLNEPTDVLSFPMDEGETLRVLGEGAPLGDIVISLETAGRQSLTREHTLEDEVRFLLVHGVCHLLGHDHGEPEGAALMVAEELRLLAVIAPGQQRPDTPY